MFCTAIIRTLEAWLAHSRYPFFQRYGKVTKPAILRTCWAALHGYIPRKSSSKRQTNLGQISLLGEQSLF